MILTPEDTKNLVSYQNFSIRDGHGKLLTKIVMIYKKEITILPFLSIPWSWKKEIVIPDVFDKFDEKLNVRFFATAPEAIELIDCLKKYFQGEWKKLAGENNDTVT